MEPPATRELMTSERIRWQHETLQSVKASEASTVRNKIETIRNWDLEDVQYAYTRLGWLEFVSLKALNPALRCPFTTPVFVSSDTRRRLPQFVIHTLQEVGNDSKY